MTVAPLKFRQTQNGDLLFADDSGAFFKSNVSFLDRLAHDQLNQNDLSFLQTNGQVLSDEDDLTFLSYAYRWSCRLYAPKELDYIILVPTLRCNLDCGYCQVSRVNETASGFDWDEQTTLAVLTYLDSLSSKALKIEFQGGEPLLRVDLLNRVRDFCRTRFEMAEFVVCTNLQVVSDEAWEFLSSSDTKISTSVDGNRSTHLAQRTKTNDATSQFFQNLRKAIDIFGPGKVSALPTLDVKSLPDPKSVIETYTSFGLRSIFLRPVNHQGFARKRFSAKDTTHEWNEYYRRFLSAVVDYNWEASEPIEEFYFSHCLRRVLRSGHQNFADLRNPNFLGRSYIVIDYNGTFFPTDEARMITRIGQLDLSLGNVKSGLNLSPLGDLNAEASNSFHPDCVHCPYQAFCGVDLVDDLSRYGRIDLPKHLTHFCHRHLAIFDLIFEYLYSKDEKIEKSMALWAGVNVIEPELRKHHR